MSSRLPLEPALRLLIAFSRNVAALDWAQSTAEAHWGPVALVSPTFEFAETQYYEASMGAGLLLRIMACAAPADPGQLAAWKLQTGGWEADYARQTPLDVPRPLNLDPGYLTLAKFVLASTKDHSHRIYLGHGVFGEVTLYYKQGRWQTHPWTYPNYQRPDYQAFLTRCRDHFASHRQKEPNR